MADQETPVVPVATSNSPAETTPEITKTEPEVIPEAAPDVQEGDQAELKTRLSAAIDDGVKKNEELRKAVDLQAEFVAENPELINKIAATDPNMANRVTEKVWGHLGIRSYKQLLEKAKQEAELSTLKESNPDLYEIKKELSETKAEIQARNERDEETTRKTFLKSKGILENEYDPKFSKFQESLKLLNPSLVKENYGQALELAHSLAFGGSKPIKEVPAPTLDLGGGTPPAPIPTQKPPVTEQSNWLANSLNEKLGYQIKI
jgi:hypothetical protein